MSDDSSRSPEEIVAAKSMAEDLKAHIAKSRGQIRRVISDEMAETSLRSLRLRALEGIRSAKIAEVSDLARALPTGRALDFDSFTPYPHTGPAVAQTAGGWTLNPALASAFDEAARTLRSTAGPLTKKTFADRLFRDVEGDRLRTAGTSMETMCRIVASVTGEISRLREEALGITARRESEVRAVRHRADEALTAMRTAHADLQAGLPAPLLPWASGAWRQWRPDRLSEEVLAGWLVPKRDEALLDNRDFACDVRLPLYTRPMSGLHLITRRNNRQTVFSLIRALLLRSLAGYPPGALQLTVFDPVGMGQSVAPLLPLSQYDPELLGGKVWSSAADFKTKLSELTAHVELVVQKFLRSDYATLKEFNEAAGEIAAPYRLLVVFDFPTYFDQESFSSLRRIIETGPRCGVGTLLVSNGDEPLPYGVDLNSFPRTMTRITTTAPFSIAGVSGYELLCDFEPDSDSAVSALLLDQVLEVVGGQAREVSGRAVGFDKVFSLFQATSRRGLGPGIPNPSSPVDPGDTTTWWSQQTVAGVSAPIGQSGARDVATLTFDSSDHAGALLVGRPGSGKSTLLHAFIAAITLLYAPEELELHLIDFKEGVEFKPYATYALPHARSVAVESDREFGLSVLHAMQAELNERAALLRGSAGSHASFEALRRKTGARLPRVVLLFDEFQVLFAQNDKIAMEAATLLESLIRQGRGFGIHLLLASQSLSGIDALGSHVPQLLPVRILLPASELDAMRVLGEGNTAGKSLLHAGEGVLNTAGGSVEANQHFRGSLLSEDRRVELLRKIRETANQAGFLRLPVVFEGNNPLPAEDTSPERFVEDIRGTSRRTLRIRFGAPMAITGSADVDLRREAGANLLLVARGASADAGVSDRQAGTTPRAASGNAIASAVAAGTRVEVVDFMPIEDGLEEVVAPYADSGAQVSIYRRRRLADLLKSLRDEVSRRVNTDDVGAESILLVLFGMHRARDFDTESLDFDNEHDLPGLLTEIVREGPEVGIHTFMWCDTVAALTRRLDSRIIREFSWRLAGQMSADDSLSIIGVDTASRLREQQLVLANEDVGIHKRCTSLSEPPAHWVNQLLSAIHHS